MSNFRARLLKIEQLTHEHDQQALNTFVSRLSENERDMLLTALGIAGPDQWRIEAIEYIQRGELSFEALVSEFDRQTAIELFEAAGVGPL